MFVKDYEIVKTIVDTENYEYEELTVKELIDKRLFLTEQEKGDILRNIFSINIHYMLSVETYDKAFEIIDKISSDETLLNLNAIVFLQYKPKGKNAENYHSVLDVEKYKKLIEYCEKNNISYGFDSCSAHMFLNSIENRRDKNILKMMAEPCESGLFSSYVNCEGKFFVCSFAEGEKEWVEGIDVLGCNDFDKDVWNSKRILEWRKKLLLNNRNCPIYDLNRKV